MVLFSVHIIQRCFIFVPRVMKISLTVLNLWSDMIFIYEKFQRGIIMQKCRYNKSSFSVHIV